MATPIIMPRQGQSVESCILVEWLVDVGGALEEGTAVASIETDKAVFEVESPEAGTLVARFFEEGDDIPVLVTIAAVAAMAALLQERALKSKTPTALTHMLPAVSTCDRLMVRILVSGEIVLAAGLLSGMALRYVDTGILLAADHKTIP